jgi:hypothetical protein
MPDMLFSDLSLALQHRSDRFIAARELTSTITQSLLKLPQKPLFDARVISITSAGVLKRFDKRAYLRYVAEHPSLQR